MVLDILPNMVMLVALFKMLNMLKARELTPAKEGGNIVSTALNVTPK